MARIGGIPILLSPSWLISILVMVVFAAPVVADVVPGTSGAASLAVAVALAVLLGLSVLAHELGHCLAARACGIPVIRVRVYLLGGVSELGRAPSGPGQDAGVAAAGPGVSALLAVLAGLLVGSFPAHTLGWLIAIQVALANGIVAIFNLLPALPMDGGHVLRAMVWKATGRRPYGTIAAAVGGGLVAVALAVWAVWALTGSGPAALLQGLIAAATAVFVGVGAFAEWRSDQGPTWPPELEIRSLARPVLQLPAEVPVALARQAAAGRSVILTGQDGAAVGLLDDAAAAGLAFRTPGAPAAHAAQPLSPETVVLPDDSTEEIVERVRGTAATHFLLVGADGRPRGVLLRADVNRILTDRSGARHRAG